MERVDEEMRHDIENQRKTNPGKLILIILAIVVAMIVVGFVGGLFSTDVRDGQHNMGTISGADSSAVTESDTTNK
jgi:hypothetical protein